MSTKEQSRLQSLPGCGSALATSLHLASVGSDSQDDFISIEEKLQGEIYSKFQPKKEKSLMLADSYLQLEYENRAFRVLDCGTFLEFSVTSDSKKLRKSNFCKDRLCPMCNWRRSLKIYNQQSQVMNFLEPQGYQYVFLTLTVRNCSAGDLPAIIQQMFDGWRYLYHKNRIFRSIVLGCHRSLEVTRNSRTFQFHPHFHNILAVKPDYFSDGYITQKRWSALWRKACNLDYEPVVHIRKFKPGKNGIASAVAEASKYAVKDSDFLVPDLDQRLSSVEALLAGLSGRRLVSDTGCFLKARQQLALGDPEAGDLVDVDGLQLREDVAQMIVRYGWRNGIYVKI